MLCGSCGIKLFRDKRNSGEVIINNLKAYRPFFNEHDPQYIEQLKDVRRKFDNYLSKSMGY